MLKERALIDQVVTGDSITITADDYLNNYHGVFWVTSIANELKGSTFESSYTIERSKLYQRSGAFIVSIALYLIALALLLIPAQKPLKTWWQTRKIKEEIGQDKISDYDRQHKDVFESVFPTKKKDEN
ncbi:MAG: hypothetical protein INQ03_20455 [Candidatus Heimdallarchaeota archaeon]|nr:hypothetical protein [Candidatus Heimdallarchaeota archaeon]